MMDVPGWHISVVDETGSTNVDLVAAAVAGAPDRTALMARYQTAGRGRLDRRWEAPAGANLLASLLLRHVPQHPAQLTWRVALAARAAVRQLTGVDASLKWPNDLLVGDAKLAGVLAEAVAADGRINAVVVGIGVNVGWAIEGAACLHGACTPEELLLEMLHQFDALSGDLAAEYRVASATLGRAVRVDLPSGASIEGRAVGVEPDGRLVVIDECALTHRLDVADIVHLRAV
jgi:BirA family transcriptional regulator, biotin operon repressor / biotin---[acetyl-CoA-carboxylase] ligase